MIQSTLDTIIYIAVRDPSVNGTTRLVGNNQLGNQGPWALTKPTTFELLSINTNPNFAARKPRLPLILHHEHLAGCHVAFQLSDVHDVPQLYLNSWSIGLSFQLALW